MSSYVIRPNAVVDQAGLVSPGTPATVLSRLSDDSDATYIQNVSGLPATWVFGLAAASVPAGEFVARVGTSIRYKADSAQYTIGGRVFRASDPTPVSRFSLAPNSGGVFTSAQLGYSSVAWTLADVAALRYVWFDNRNNDNFIVTQHADIWATVYTLTKATATPKNKTENSSVFPVLEVDVAATLDWEVSSLDWQNLRRVGAEVRIESGGTTVGTGTLVTTATSSTIFTESGTRTVEVTVTDPLPNGSYKIYARALRYREDGVTRTDQYGDWSTAKTLTMSAPSPIVPTVVVVPDHATESNVVTVTATESSNYLGPYVYLERSDDSGQTWAPVRFASGIAATFGVPSTFYDNEAPRSVTGLYRARVEATYSGAFINKSQWSTPVASNIPAHGWNLKDPADITLSIVGLNVVGEPDEAVEEDLGVFRPLGRRYPVTVGGTLSGWDGGLELVLASDTEWLSVRRLVESQRVLLLQSAFGWSKYVRLLSGTKSRQSGTLTTPRRRVSLTYVEVDKPAITTGDSLPVVIVPDLVDGGSADVIFASFADGGSATSIPLATFDGEDA